MTRLNLNALRVFSVVARHGNLQHAADELNVSRGAVSQRIRRLELDLGVVLLQRETRGVSLTPAGERCRAAIDNALGTLETALVDISGAMRVDHVTLHLGPSTAAKWLMPRMKAFSDRFPGITLRTEVHDRILSRNLGRNEIAIWPGKAADRNPTHRTQRLVDIRLVAVCSPDLMLPHTPMALDELVDLPLLQDAHRRWDALFGIMGQHAPRKVLNFDRAALALDAAMEGHGIAIAPTYMVERDICQKRLVEIWAHPDPTDDCLFVSWSGEHGGQRHLERIVDWIQSGFEDGAR
ncbi:LysR family transcriptional regulator [Tateyamaria omphalii]|uniref:LysR family transcriptional regulator n=1 Tax=Tateyamaria omphalii TaxID=299262 RepID=UPI001C997ADB|nr:LysR substrate-binding domain-containing protein [Tateyamaria omphalii]MBY5931512.1 LysR family transcriptional regulator [Tateyamaria omphalii]